MHNLFLILTGTFGGLSLILLTIWVGSKYKGQCDGFEKDFVQIYESKPRRSTHTPPDVAGTFFQVLDRRKMSLTAKALLWCLALTALSGTMLFFN